MRTLVCLIVLAAFCASLGWSQRRGPWRRSPAETENPPQAKDDAEKRVLAVIEEAERSGRVFASVPANDGRVLRLLTEAAGARHVVEIGASTGYSGLWFCLALQKTQGKLTTFELDARGPPWRASISSRRAWTGWSA